MGYKIVCLDCRKAFNDAVSFNEARIFVCPDCGQPALRLTHRFRPPQKKELKKWAVVKFLHQHGFYYDHVSDGISYANYPNTMAEAREFIVKYASQARAKR